jgi:hypothetical protein
MLSQEAFDFIKNNINEDPRSLALKTHGSLKENMGFLLTQIKQKQRVDKKLPLWHSNPRLLFGTSLSAEQCSSEITAEFKASLFSGKNFLDLTGGLGIDTLAFSKTFESGIYIEYNEELSKIAAHNFTELGIKNIGILNVDGIDFLKRSEETFDLIYIDPDRRHEESRVYDFENSLPNILDHLDVLLQKGKQVLIKGSPMLDIHLAVKQLKYVEKIWVVSHKNECKEILFLLSKEQKACEITAVELGTKHCVQDTFPSENENDLPLSAPKKYMYDPFVSIRKAQLVECVNNVSKTHPTNAPSISTSEELEKDFPGRCFERIEIFPPTAKELKKRNIKRANIVSRGSIHDANTLHKNLKIERGGDDYLITILHSSQKIELVHCRKVY